MSHVGAGSQIHDGGHTVGAGAELPAEQLHSASLHVAGNARDAEDCRMLLDMLGLLDTPIRSSSRIRRQHARTSRARRKEAAS